MVSLNGVSIHDISLTELFDRIRLAIVEKRNLAVGNVNIHAMNLAWERPRFKEALAACEIVFCDGYGVKLGARLSGQRIRKRYTPPDFIHPLMQLITEENGGVYLLGAAAGVAERAAERLVRETRGLRIAGCHHGYFNKTPGHPENEAVLETVNTAKPALLLLGFGMPMQEEWWLNNRERLDVPVVMMVGALFDTLCGDIRRAPRWLTDHGMEWLARLAIEPRRLWKRYLVGNPLFLWRVICHHWFGRHLIHNQ